MEISNLLFSPHQEYLLSIDNQGFLYVFCFKELTIGLLKSDYDGTKLFTYICKFKLRNDKINSIIFAKKDCLYLLCSGLNDIKAFEWKDLLNIIEERKSMNYNQEKEIDFTNKEKNTFKIDIVQQDDINPNYLKFSFKEESCELATAAANGTIYIFDFATQELKSTLKKKTHKIDYNNNNESIGDFSFRSQNQIISGTNSGLIQLWDYKNESIISTFSEKNSQKFSKINTLELEESENWVIIGHDDYISKWNVNMGYLSFILDTNIKTNCIRVTKDHFFSGHDDEIVSKWSVDGNYISGCSTFSKGISSILIENNSQKSLMLTAGCGPFIDVFHNNINLYSFIIN